MESVKVVGKYTCFAEPLSVKLTPKRLTPAGVGDGKVQSVGIYVMPMLCGRIMTESVFIRMGCDTGITCGTRGKEHKHRVVTAGSVFGTEIMCTETLHFNVKVVPAVLLSADQNLYHIRKFCRCLFGFGGNLSVGGTNDCLYLRRLISISKIVLNELICSGDCDCTELMKRKHTEPELIVALENKHYCIALFDAERFKVVGGFCRIFFQIAECKLAVGFIVRNPHHCELIGILFGDSVNAVEGKIEFVLVLEFNAAEYAVFVIEGFHKIIGNRCGGCFLFDRFGNDIGGFGVFLADETVLRIEDNCVEFASALANCYHAVGNQAVIKYRVAFVKDVNVIADLNLKRALYDNVEFLTIVRIELHGCILFFGEIREFDQKRLGKLILEFRCKVVVFNAVLL